MKSALERALVARVAYLAARTDRTRRQYETALRACSSESARELIAHVGLHALTPGERQMPRLGAALKEVVHL